MIGSFRPDKSADNKEKFCVRARCGNTESVDSQCLRLILNAKYRWTSATSSRSQNLDKGIGDDCPAPPNYTKQVADVLEPPPSPHS